MITKGRTGIERKLLRQWSFIEKVVQEGILKGYRLYVIGYFGLPSFRDYHWCG